MFEFFANITIPFGFVEMATAGIVALQVWLVKQNHALAIKIARLEVAMRYLRLGAVTPSVPAPDDDRMQFEGADGQTE